MPHLRRSPISPRRPRPWVDRAVALAHGDALGLRARLAWANDQSSNSSANAVFQSLPGAGFTVSGATPAHNLALTSLNGEYRMANGWSFDLRLDGEFASSSQTYAGTGTIRRVF